jgi:hypothetical protein
MNDDVYLKPSIPDDEYIVEFVGYFTAKVFSQRTPKVCLEFSIVEGDYADYRLERWYTVRRVDEPIGKLGQFIATSATCVLLMEYCTCFPDQNIDRLDRIPMSRWRQGRFVVRTKTPEKNHAGKLTPLTLRTSLIKEIIGLA